MSDFEELIQIEEPKKKTRKRIHKNEKDDIGGMMINMGSHIDVREIFIIWVVFIFLHTELFVECILKKISGASNDDNTMTMKGTFIASILMILAVIICAMTF